MLSLSNLQISEKNGVLSLSANLFSSQSNQSYTLRCEVERNGAMPTLDHLRAEHLDRPSKTVQAALPSP
ncbi:hypothetical protein [Rhizobium sp. RM]|uniref:hypothetical protein n=1 Tax=Rhizobium sp. RM TaxID=2748079 RepID=UPI00110D962A|nr:hypothetical protein [Rhizobium sp. RM]NWJ23557.1 hypothetical protein [Rhizobium sp. RM]TMV19242.1 hypothetical protein BJG94_14140 [Rhizobium sp. Td3]